MSRHRGPDREFVEAHGGVISDGPDGYRVDFPTREQPAFTAKDIEAAIDRAREYGTTFIRLWRQRGDGWYAATSHAEHPGSSYICRIDERTGAPISCECVATAGCCHHLGAVVASWRVQSDYDANAADVLAAWGETLRMVRANMPSRMQEEAW